MDKISNINSIVNILREQISSNKSDKTGKSTPHVPSTASQSGRVEANRPLASILDERLKKLRRNDPDYSSKARKVLVESILISEFGENIINDPSYGELFDRIVTAFNSESRISGKIDNLLLSESQ